MAGESIAQSGTILRKAVQAAYNHLGLNMLLSGTWFLLGFLPLFYLFVTIDTAWALEEVQINAPSVVLFGFTCYAVIVLWTAPATAALFASCHRLVTEREMAYREAFSLWRRFYLRSVRLSAVVFGLLAVLIIDVYFFMSVGPGMYPALSGILPWIGIFWIQMIAFWCLAAQFVCSLLVQQETTMGKVLKRAALIALDNLVVSFVLVLVVAALIAMFMSFTPFWVLFILFFGGTVGFLHSVALTEILKKYDREPGPTERASGA